MKDLHFSHPQNITEVTRVATDTRELVQQRIGRVELSDRTFTETQREFFKGILSIVDRNPVVEWRKNDPNHNLDFCLIEGNLEPTKSFHMKAAYFAGVSIRADSSPVITSVPSRDGKTQDTVVTVPVTVEKDGRVVTMNGGSSFSEVDKYGNNSRRMHDAIARAQTRGMKIALENLLGFAFINLVMQAVFGGFQVHDDGQPRDVSPERGPDSSHKPDPATMSPEARKIGGRIWRRMVHGVKNGVLTEAQQDKLWLRVQMNVDRPDVLARIEEDVTEACSVQGAPQWQ